MVFLNGSHLYWIYSVLISYCKWWHPAMNDTSGLWNGFLWFLHTVFVPRDRKDRCSGQQSDLCPSYQTTIFCGIFLWAVCMKTHPSCRRLEALAPPSPTIYMNRSFWALGSQRNNPSSPEATQGWEWFPQSRNAYLTVQLIVVKYLEGWNDGKSLHILARNHPADIQFPNGYTDLRVLRGAS